jgi:hypothetical protein
MIRPRLRVKAAGYAAYVYERAWAQRHPFCPALLFLTTGEARALAFLKLLASELERLGRGRWRGWCLRSGPARDFELWDVVSYRRRTNRDSIWIGTRRTFRRPSGLTLRKEATDPAGARLATPPCSQLGAYPDQIRPFT